jgi:wobble nucleotide-excising tRNase
MPDDVRDLPMIKKILEIKSVGKFVRYSCKGDTEFRSITLIFGENGAGKTMLSAILRSLGNADPTCLLERKTVSSSAPPEAVVRVDNANHTFKNGNWDISAPGIHVFDTTFVNENVYSGVYVDVEHKRNLYKFIVGKTGVLLATAVDELDVKIRAKNTEIGEGEKLIKPYILGSCSVQEFVNIPAVQEVDKNIKEKSAALAALKEASVIAARATLGRLSIPSFRMKDFESLLLKTLEDVAANAEKLTREHISSCMDKQGEAWVGKGLTYIKGDRCPFCGQALPGVELIKAYRAFFSAGYASLKAEINEARGKANDQFSQQAILGAQSAIATNSLNAEFWRNYLDIQNPTMDFEELRLVWETLHGLIDEYLRRKEASPLDAFQTGDDVRQAFQEYDGAAEKIARYNQAVDAANALIGQIKQKTAGGSLADAEAELVALQNAKKRHQDAVVRKLCEDYLRLHQEKQKLDGDKSKAKKKLDSYAESVLPEYEKSINKHLGNFGAGFKLCNAGTKYTGGKPSADYQLSINDTPVSLGDTKSAPTNPCFRNTLSAGDKSTLAFALFIARLERDAGLPDAIIVFDDPVSSLDANRRQCTQHEISELAKKANQVIVLSHDPHFLLSIWGEEKQLPLKTLQIARKGQESSLEEWDIEIATRDAYLCDYFCLDEYLAKGTSTDLRAVARCIRPLLEGNLRLRFPKSFKRDEWLGDFIKKIRDAGSKDTLGLLKPKLPELEAINDYSKKYYHDQNPNGWATEPINDAALQAYSKRAMAFACGV